MPRGDGRDEFEPRPHRKRLNLPQYVPKGLVRRVKWWEEFGGDGNKVSNHTPTIKYTNYDGILDFRRPGSQKK